MYNVYRSTLSSFLFKIGILSDGAPSDPLVDWDRVRYTVSVFLPLDAFGILVKGDHKTEKYGGSLMGFGVQKWVQERNPSMGLRTESGV